MRIGLVGTFPPRECGLATYGADLDRTLRDAGYHTVVAAVVDGDTVDGDTVAICRDDDTAYRRVADELSALVDVVVVQHEFGIYGGWAGCLLRELTDRLAVPFVVVLHTVAGEYTPAERASLVPVLDRAGQVHVFSAEARDLLHRQGLAASCDVRMVAHGVPAQIVGGSTRDEARRALGLDDRAVVLSTFGLLSAGKGIETAIASVAALRNAVDDVRYIVAGRTHPAVVAREGETYRRSLEALSVELGVDREVMFLDQFLSVEELGTLLAASDVFLTPYAGAEQIVSGALSYAVAAGVPFVSTPYRYANEMARAGAGVIVPWEAGANGFATALKELLSDPVRRARLVRSARKIGQRTTWERTGGEIAAHLTDLRRTRPG